MSKEKENLNVAENSALNTIQAKSLVTYNGERGKVKSLHPDGEHAYVCFHCSNQWDRIHLYTGQLTRLADLVQGWPENNQQSQELGFCSLWS